MFVKTAKIHDNLDKLFSAAGKILRRELRDRAKKELAGKDSYDDHVSAKL